MSKKILVLGEICHDVFVKGKVPRLCPEGPFPIFIPNKTNENFTDGMAGNVIRNINSLSRITLNGPSEFIIEGVHQEKPILKTRYVDEVSNYTLMRQDENDDVELIAKEKVLEIISRIKSKEFDAVIFSDYNKGFLSEDIIEKITFHCRDNGVVSFLDTKKILGLWSFDVTFVKINSKEWEENLSYRRKYKLELETRVCQNLIVTLGGKGSDLWEGNKGKITIPTKEVQISNLSGAGDTMLSGLVVKYLETKDIHKSVEYGNYCASYKVSKPGIVAPTAFEIWEFLGKPYHCYCGNCGELGCMTGN